MYAMYTHTHTHVQANSHSRECEKKGNDECAALANHRKWFFSHFKATTSFRTSLGRQKIDSPSTAKADEHQDRFPSRRLLCRINHRSCRTEWRRVDHQWRVVTHSQWVAFLSRHLPIFQCRTAFCSPIRPGREKQSAAESRAPVAKTRRTFLSDRKRFRSCRHATSEEAQKRKVAAGSEFVCPTANIGVGNHFIWLKQCANSRTELAQTSPLSRPARSKGNAVGEERTSIVNL